MADRVAVMNDGRIEQVGTPREIYTAPVNAFVAGFIGETNVVKGVVESVEPGGGASIETAVGSLCGVVVPHSTGVGDHVLCSFRPESVTLGTDSPVGPNQFAATIEGAMYLGAVEEFRLKAGELSLRATMHNPRHLGRGRGNEVTVSVDPADIVVLRDERETR